jgi:hypothetical protein
MSPLPQSLLESNDCPSLECLPAKFGDGRIEPVPFAHCSVHGRAARYPEHPTYSWRTLQEVHVMVWRGFSTKNEFSFLKFSE